MRTFVLFGLCAVMLIGVAVFAAFRLSPWPSVLLIRHASDQGAAEAAASVAPHVPQGVTAQRGLSYAAGDPDTKFDLFMPAHAGPLPAIIWVHGGGFISGTRSDMAGYLQVLAGRGFVTIGIDYSLAPEAEFPTPVEQTNLALAYVAAHAARFNIDPARIFLAGDSAGAQIAAQTALVISDPAYAVRMGLKPGLPPGGLRGLVLYCGPYDPSVMNFDGPFGDFMRTVLWSYLDTRDPHGPAVARIAVTPHVGGSFPPAFISAGNADPLAPQSAALADALRARGVMTETLFFPADHDPPLGHEYQFLLSTPAGREALEKSVAFLNALTAKPVGAE